MKSSQIYELTFYKFELDDNTIEVVFISVFNQMEFDTRSFVLWEFKERLVWFGLVSLFNSISTFVGYVMPKLFSKKNSSGTI